MLWYAYQRWKICFKVRRDGPYSFIFFSVTDVEIYVRMIKSGEMGDVEISWSNLLEGSFLLFPADVLN